MWRSLTTGFRSATGPAMEENNAENGGRNHIFDDDADEEDEVASKVEYSEAQLLPCESEKKHILQMFYTMRKDSFFCDVAFVCNGVLFRAHRVVVSSWSRWLRALLCESPDEEVVSLDFFDATAFGAALDYMYGVPLTITVENADHVLKVVRRLEMQKLEQQCWRYLMTVIDPATNAEILHELADRYDCPPLKLAAWRILQEKMPANGASLATSRLLKKGKEGMQAKVGFTGLTGPGEPWFNTSVGLNSSSTVLAGDDGGRLNVRNSYSDVDGEVVDEEEDELRRAKRFMPSVFSELKEADGEDDETEAEDLLEDEFGSEDGDSEYRARRNKFGWDITNYKDPTELDTSASAAEIVQAWAFRLKEIYDQCNPANALDYEDEDNFRIAPGSPNVRLTTYQRSLRATNNNPRDKRSALLGDLDEESVSLPPPRPAADPFFKLVPSSSSVGGGRDGGHAGVMPGGGVSVAGAGPNSAPSPSPRRPPAPTAANTFAPGASSPSPKAGAGGGGANRWPPSSAHKTIDWREEMKRFYVAIGLPEKIAGINTILSTWAGKEEQMLASLMEKYHSSIPPQMNAHLEQLLAQLETHTESSFVRGPSVTNNTAPPPPAASPRSPPRSARRNKF